MLRVADASVLAVWGRLRSAWTHLHDGVVVAVEEEERWRKRAASDAAEQRARWRGAPIASSASGKTPQGRSTPRGAAAPGSAAAGITRLGRGAWE